MRRFHETARLSKVAPIGNRLYRRLAAGLAERVASQYGIQQKCPGKKILEEI
jgi:hypothetical protein